LSGKTAYIETAAASGSGGSGSLNRISASLSGNSCQGLGQRGSA
jgi:hypothetical protein